MSKNALYKLLEFMIKRKDILTYQMINKIRFLEKNIILDLNNKYDMLGGNININEIKIKNDEDKNRIMSVIKFKGFKTHINELLDKEIDVSDYIKTSRACKSMNLFIINPSQKDITERNNKNLNLLKYIQKESHINKHLFQFKKQKNNIKNIFYNILKINNMKNKSKIKLPITPNNKKILFAREKTYDNYNNVFNNTFLSPMDNNKNNAQKLFNKVFPNLNPTNRINKMSKKIYTMCSSPLKEKELSSNFTETENDIKIKKNNNNSEKKNYINNMSKTNYFTKIFKRKNIILESSKTKDKENEEKNNNNYEKLYYDRLKREQKDFLIGEKFNKKFMSEINKIRPMHYKSFYLK